MTPSVCYVWQHKDSPILLPAAKGKRLSVLGLMTPECKLFYQIFEGSVNSDAAIAVMDKFFQSINKRTVVVIDNTPIHRSKKFRAKIDQWKQQDIWIYFLPAYSPELNLIEILWRNIKYQWLPFDAFMNFQRLNVIYKRIKLLGQICKFKYFIILVNKNLRK